MERATVGWLLSGTTESAFMVEVAPGGHMRVGGLASVLGALTSRLFNGVAVATIIFAAFIGLFKIRLLE